MWNYIFLTWSAKCIMVNRTADNQGSRFTITDTTPFVPVQIFTAQVNVKLLQQSKQVLGEKLTEININENQYYRRETDI